MQTLHLRFRALRGVPHRHGRARRPFQTILDQLQQLDRVPKRRASSSPDAPLRGPVCRWRLRSGSLVLSDLSVPTRDGFAGRKPQRTIHALPPTLQAPFSEVLRTPSNGLSFPLRPQRTGARAYGVKTADQTASVVALAGASSGAYWQRFRLGSGER